MLLALCGMLGHFGVSAGLQGSGYAAAALLMLLLVPLLLLVLLLVLLLLVLLLLLLPLSHRSQALLRLRRGQVSVVLHAAP